MAKVLDASALVSYLWKQTGYDKVQDLLSKAASSEKWLLMSTVNLGEVYYLLIRDHGIDNANNIMRSIETLPIEFVPPDMLTTKQAAYYKAVRKLPYVDCFAAALAKVHKGEVVTGDKEFKAVENDVRVVWVH